MSTTMPLNVFPYKTGTTFKSMTTGERFHIITTTDRHTRNVVYLTECTKCSVKYVRETKNIEKESKSPDEDYQRVR